MFTNNLINYQKAAFFGSSFEAVDTEGVKRNPALASYTHFNAAPGSALSNPRCKSIVNTGSSYSAPASGVYFGSGPTPATKDDFNLESPITSGLSFTAGKTITGKEADGKYVVYNTFVVKNTTGAPITIYEIGAFVTAATANTTWYSFLIDRTVLDEPIVIDAGDEKIVTYKWTFNQTLNVE